MEDVPLIVRAKHLPDGTPMTEALETMLRSYLASLPEDRRRLLSRYRIVDVARKVVGVGSVGTSCWVVLLEEQGADSPLFLQIKEARESVLARHLDSKRSIKQQGRRVVIGQRMIQGSPDIFLGWGPVNSVNGSRHYYVRQLADMKGGLRLNEGDREALGGLSQVLWSVRLGARACSCEVGRCGDDIRLLRHRRCASGCHRKIFVEPILSRPSVTMAHLRRRPGVAGSRWPDRLERTGPRWQAAFGTGDHLQEHSVFDCGQDQ